MKLIVINVMAGCLAIGLLATGAIAQTKGPGSETLPARVGCVAIPDDGYDGSIGSMVCQTVAVVAAGTIDDVNVNVGMEHTWAGDLVIKVVAPDMTTATVLSRPGFVEPADDGTGGFGDSSDLVATSVLTYDDKGGGISAEDMGGTILGTAVICQDDLVCNYTSSPGAAAGVGLLDFNGLTVAAGDWQVCVGDAGGGDTGNLCDATLDITFGVPELSLGMITEMDVCA